MVDWTHDFGPIFLRSPRPCTITPRSRIEIFPTTTSSFFIRLARWRAHRIRDRSAYAHVYRTRSPSIAIAFDIAADRHPAEAYHFTRCSSSSRSFKTMEISLERRGLRASYEAPYASNDPLRAGRPGQDRRFRFKFSPPTPHGRISTPCGPFPFIEASFQSCIGPACARVVFVRIERRDVARHRPPR
ncbi:hypothetical protein EXIGLDRAFT_355850 [Exidia glandulosa HHB12029]|uniref:Uncharacterized protein n=1 Tax=Exidia glandulosa HHB12029 TaxID=1314781 RepID=A0A165CAN3_EXIGL|nr:hypothetical protein EXIGLDRAFT_355850 [Exidia glandulosa HHB12029]